MVCSLASPDVRAEQGTDSFASDNRNEREMVQALEAYAVYKMGNYIEAFERFLSLAEMGNVQGMLNVANMYAVGVGVKENQRIATDWYQRAAGKGSVIAMKEYAMRLGQGKGVAQDTNASARLLKELESETGANGVDTASGSNRQLSLNEITPLLESRLKDFDQAATERSAAGMVDWIHPDTRILVVLPGTMNWTTLNKIQLQALWQTGFETTGEYHFRRSNTDYWIEESRRIRASFKVLEEWRSNAEPEKILQRVVIQNELRLAMYQDALKVEEWKMHIRQAH